MFCLLLQEALQNLQCATSQGMCQAHLMQHKTESRWAVWRLIPLVWVVLANITSAQPVWSAQPNLLLSFSKPCLKMLFWTRRTYTWVTSCRVKHLSCSGAARSGKVPSFPGYKKNTVKAGKSFGCTKYLTLLYWAVGQGEAKLKHRVAPPSPGKPLG